MSNKSLMKNINSVNRKVMEVDTVNYIRNKHKMNYNSQFRDWMICFIEDKYKIERDSLAESHKKIMSQKEHHDQ